MTSGKQGKPFCARAALYLSKARVERQQCQECAYIRWIGCPSFEPKFTMCQSNKTAEYIREFFLGEQVESTKVVK